MFLKYFVGGNLEFKNIFSKGLSEMVTELNVASSGDTLLESTVCSRDASLGTIVEFENVFSRRMLEAVVELDGALSGRESEGSVVGSGGDILWGMCVEFGDESARIRSVSRAPLLIQVDSTLRLFHLVCFDRMRPCYECGRA